MKRHAAMTSFTPYNADGTLLRKTDAQGQKIEFTYDNYRRVTQKRTLYSGGSENLDGRVDYTYNTLGQLASIEGGATQPAQPGGSRKPTRMAPAGSSPPRPCR